MISYEHFGICTAPMGRGLLACSNVGPSIVYYIDGMALAFFTCSFAEENGPGPAAKVEP
jgi:hypothetical protein